MATKSSFSHDPIGCVAKTSKQRQDKTILDLYFNKAWLLLA
ncbi:hypothetical protein EV14_0015 [Prochlorococcus sp. MIT 0703]|nr:hypothetical protein EV12_0923 [Prochlorococcus sp. MIT 0701]KGG37223.1 hypothetical protein EV14_0015 [Prochlorococcus sp. MIT 0703]